jgi:hypothetical protein
LRIKSTNAVAANDEVGRIENAALYEIKHRPINPGALRFELVAWNLVIRDPQGLLAKTAENLRCDSERKKKEDTLLKRADIIAYTIISLHTL